MKTKIAINGFGRIGRNAFKVAFERTDLEIVAVNDLTDTKTLAYLLKHDSNYGTYQHEVSSDETNLVVEDQKIKVLAEKDPAALPWKDLGVDVVIECTGFFTDPAKAKAHLGAGAKKVVLSAPAKGDGADTVVIGVNEDKLASATDVISNASCTTNCITPIAAIIENNFGIEKAMMTTVHSYTASQVLQDGPAKEDLREARAAAVNIVPTTTGASVAAAKALPALQGIFGGLSVRVPTPVVSLSDFAILTKKNVTVEEVNEAFKKAAGEPYYQGILDVTEEPLVSTDFIGNSHSAIVDLSLTNVVGGNLLKVVAWYDNEWGYSNRLVELTADIGKALQGGGSDTAEPKLADEADKEPASDPAETEPTSEIVDTKPEAVDDQPSDKIDVDVKVDGSQNEQTAQTAPEMPDPAKDEPLLEAPSSAGEELLSPPIVEQPKSDSSSQPSPKAGTVESDSTAAYHITTVPESLEEPDSASPKTDNGAFRHF